MQPPRTLTIRIEIPALDLLVAWLQAQAVSRSQIESLTAQVSTLTARLEKSGKRLDAAVSTAT